MHLTKLDFLSMISEHFLQTDSTSSALALFRPERDALVCHLDPVAVKIKCVAVLRAFEVAMAVAWYCASGPPLRRRWGRDRPLELRPSPCFLWP